MKAIVYACLAAGSLFISQMTYASEYRVCLGSSNEPVSVSAGQGWAIGVVRRATPGCSDYVKTWGPGRLFGLIRSANSDGCLADSDDVSAEFPADAKLSLRYENITVHQDGEISYKFIVDNDGKTIAQKTIRRRDVRPCI